MSDRIIHLELETITPVFAGGATPLRIDPHMPIRPSAVRGALRQWFRAAAAAVLLPEPPGPDSVNALVKELAGVEAQIFGETDRASSVAVRAPDLDTRGALRHYPPGAPDRDRWPGLRYLGYGLFENRRTGAQAIAERKRFALQLTLRRDQPGLRELLSATLWLWLNLGALGARSRRGFGAMRLYPGRHAGFSCPDDLLMPPADHRVLAGYLAHGTDWAWKTFHRHLSTTHEKRLPDELGPKAAAVPMRTLAGIGAFTPLPHEFGDPVEALDFAGQLFRDYRSTLQRGHHDQPPLPDYTAVKAALQNKQPPSAVERAAFGLPLPFYFRSLGNMRTRFVPVRDGKKVHDRLASPLCIRICPVGDAHTPRHVPVLYNWAGARGAKPLLDCKVWDTRSRGVVPTIPDNRIITSFIEWARKQPPTPAGRAPARRRR